MSQEITEQEKRQRLEKLCTPEFLERLIEVGKLYGWDGDYGEVCDFIRFLHPINTITIEDLIPYEII